jgi:hypothetical protein
MTGIPAAVALSTTGAQTLTVDRGENDRVDLAGDERLDRRDLFLNSFMAGYTVDLDLCSERFAFRDRGIGHVLHEDVADDGLWQNADDRLGGASGTCREADS